MNTSGRRVLHERFKRTANPRQILRGLTAAQDDVDQTG
jgi:hypothetical protein